MSLNLPILIQSSLDILPGYGNHVRFFFSGIRMQWGQDKDRICFYHARNRLSINAIALHCSADHSWCIVLSFSSYQNTSLSSENKNEINKLVLFFYAFAHPLQNYRSMLSGLLYLKLLGSVRPICHYSRRTGAGSRSAESAPMAAEICSQSKEGL